MEIVAERWRGIAETNGRYEVSDFGRIRRASTGSLRSPHHCRKGYLRIRFVINGVRKSHFVHRLVASAFVPNPLDKATVNHEDGDRTNNRASNLSWATIRENCRHALRTGLRIIPKNQPNIGRPWMPGRKSPVRLPHDSRKILAKRYFAGETAKQLASEFDISLSAALIIIRQNKYLEQITS